MKQVDAATARAIGDAWEQLQTTPAEAVSPAIEALARNPKALYGVWSIREFLARTNGKGGPSKPIVPGTWEFKKGGELLVRGANAIDARYIYTGDRLIVSGFGPVQDYHVDRLTTTELQITTVFEASSLRLENTTTLERAR